MRESICCIYKRFGRVWRKQKITSYQGEKKLPLPCTSTLRKIFRSQRKFIKHRDDRARVAVQ